MRHCGAVSSNVLAVYGDAEQVPCLSPSSLVSEFCTQPLIKLKVCGVWGVQASQRERTPKGGAEISNLLEPFTCHARVAGAIADHQYRHAHGNQTPGIIKLSHPDQNFHGSP